MSGSAPFWNRSRVFALVSMLLLAASLRAGVTAFGPLVTRIGDDVGLDATTLGALAALPVFAFGIFALPTARFARALGFDRLALVGLLVVASGLALRLLVPAWALWIGTGLLGVGIATLNVLLPVLVKRDFHPRAPLVLGMTTCVMTACASLGAGLAVVITEATGGQWRIALAASLPVALACAALFLVRSKRGDHAANLAAAGGSTVRLARSPIAWSVCAYMGLQSMVFYTFTNWMPTIERAQGIDEASAGFHLALAQMVGVPFGFLAAWIMNRARDQRIIAVGYLPLTLIGLLGAMFVPQFIPVFTVMIGITTGMMLPVAMGLISERTATAADAVRMSGMAQSIGYVVAGLGPIIAGGLFEATGGWMAGLGLLVAVVLGLMVAGVFAGRDRTIGEPAPAR